jgi:chorismate mutase
MSTTGGGAEAKVLRALRGATTVAVDEADEVVRATAELLQEMFDRNGAERDDLVSVVFTVTQDLRSEFPAAAARKLGIADVPLLCATEIPVQGAIPRCVRVLMHLYTDRPRGELRHVYLGEARQLRTDLPE